MIPHAVRITRARTESGPEGMTIVRSDVPLTFPLNKTDGDVRVSFRATNKKVYHVTGHYSRDGRTIYIPLENWPESLEKPTTEVADGAVWHDVLNIVEL